MEIESLIFWNPWWEDKKNVKKLIGIKRERYKNLFNLIKIKEVIILAGIRRSGKSTLMYQLIDYLISSKVEPKQILYINFDDPKFDNLDLEEFYYFYKKNVNLEKKSYIFLDEVQNVKNWEKVIKKFYDSQENVKFFVSGSSSTLISRDYSKLLTGRNITIKISPLNFKEFLTFKNFEIPKNINLISKNTKLKILNYLEEYFNFGGFPEIVFKDKELKVILLEQYFNDIIYKDVIERYKINTTNIKNFTLYILTNFTKFFSLRKTRENLNLSYDSIKSYLQFLKEVYLIDTINKFSYSLNEQYRNLLKLYVVDNGLRNISSFKFSEDIGKLAENTTFLKLKESYDDIYYWKNSHEVDFIIKDKDNKLIAINVTYDDVIKDRELVGLNDFYKLYENKIKKLILITKDTEKKVGKIYLVPLWKFLLE